MSLKEEVDLLRNIPLFSKVDPSKLKLLAFASERLTFAPGQELFRQGDSGDAAYIVIAGEAEVLVDAPGGPVAVARVGKNDLVGEIAILCDVPRTATVKALSNVVTLAISKDLFFQMVSEYPQFAIEVMRELAERLDRTTGQLREAVSAKARS
ncbi:MAG: cyclic nucleotide-binding domain-containing protein [Alphaproteobacteria bacterium]|nr:cyclic nucleotide-binding domain-containing protein [Alphaproteobacteria bacterium]